LMKQVRTATFNGRKYRVCVDEDGLDGWCDQYKLDKRYISINKKLNTMAGLITVIHEALHASNWAVTEKVIDRVSTEIGRLLWRLGYRLVKVEKGKK
jgi:hypothetical protein